MLVAVLIGGHNVADGQVVSKRLMKRIDPLCQWKKKPRPAVVIFKNHHCGMGYFLRVEGQLS